MGWIMLDDPSPSIVDLLLDDISQVVRTQATWVSSMG